MHAVRTYQQQRAVGWTRIDLLLTLFDRAVSELEGALAAREAGGAEAARPGLLRFQGLLSGLVAGVNPEGGELAANFLRLYEFAFHCASQGKPEDLRAALTVLRTLREGLVEIRPEARRLEREGVVPPPPDLAASVLHEV